MSACMNTPGMSHVETSLFYLSSISQDSNIKSVVAESEIFLPLSCIIFSLFHTHTLKSWFSAAFLLQEHLIFVRIFILFFRQHFGLSDCPNSRICSYFIYWRTSSDLSSTNTCSPFLNEYCMMYVFSRSYRTE